MSPEDTHFLIWSFPAAALGTGGLWEGTHSEAALFCLSTQQRKNLTSHPAEFSRAVHLGGAHPLVSSNKLRNLGCWACREDRSPLHKLFELKPVPRHGAVSAVGTYGDTGPTDTRLGRGLPQPRPEGQARTDSPDQVDGLVLVEDPVARPLFIQELGRERAVSGGHTCNAPVSTLQHGARCS